MDAFEAVVAAILERDGFWVRTSLKVKLTPQDKRDIGRTTSPRWELDVVGYRPGDNVLRVVECKSYLDSSGVNRAAFEPGSRFGKRFKLFNEPVTRRIVFNRLIAQLAETKSVRKAPKVQLCLAAGRIAPASREKVRTYFELMGWELFDAEWLRESITRMADDGYDNAIAAVTAKLLLRDFK
jgi:hypothetical protein